MEEIVLCPIKTIGWDNFWSWAQGGKNYAELVINFIYSEKATKFCETSTVDLYNAQRWEMTVFCPVGVCEAPVKNSKGS